MLKKLSDETYEYGASDFRRTIWYQDKESNGIIGRIFSQPDEYGCRMIVPGSYLELARALKSLIDTDLQSKTKNEPSEIHWIFYSSIVSGDAIEDKVRFSIYIRLKHGQYSCHVNMSDFIFASSYDEVLKIKGLIESQFNE